MRLSADISKGITQYNYILKYIFLYRYLAKQFTCFLYGCETWSFTLMEEQRLRMSENRMLRRLEKTA
jgi:hypothetical protein